MRKISSESLLNPIYGIVLDRMEDEKRLPQAIVARSPFSRAMLILHLPVSMRHHPELTFDGDDDPASCYMRFIMEMDVYQVPSLTRCRIFVASLRGRAQLWFSKLARKIIRSWESMGDFFIRKFRSSMAYAPPMATLANINQRNGETLHNYFSMFNVVVLYVRGAADEAVKNFLIDELRRGSDFWNNIQAHELVTLQEFYRQDEPYKIVEKSMVELQRGSPPPCDNYRFRNR